MKSIIDSKTLKHRGYKNHGNRKQAIKQLAKWGWNYFVCYKDTQSPFALQYSHADFVAEGKIYVAW